MSQSTADALENTCQLLDGGVCAAKFMINRTRSDIREIRRIVFQMLGMDHLVVFINTCCNYFEIGDDVLKMAPMADLVAEQASEQTFKDAQAAKKNVFDYGNVSRLLYFAVECGLDLRLSAHHKLARTLREQGTRLHALHKNDLTGEHKAMPTIEMLMTIRLRGEHIDGVITRAVLNCTPFDVSTTRLHPGDSGSAVWFEILEMLFVYHQYKHPELSTIRILIDYCLCGHSATFKPLTNANKHDKQRRMLPYLLSKPDLSNGRIIVRFFRRTIDAEYIGTCAELCKTHKSWPQTCVGLISLFAKHNDFVANVSLLPGLGHVKSQHDVVIYMLMHMRFSGRMCGLHYIGDKLIQMLIKADALTTDQFFIWIDMNNRAMRVSDTAIIFAAQLFLTHSVAERTVLFERFRVADVCDDCVVEIINILLLENGSLNHRAARNLSSVCRIYLALNMLELDLDIRVIEYVLGEACCSSHCRRIIPRLSEKIFRLCEYQLRFDLLLGLVKQHWRAQRTSERAREFIKELKKLTCYEPAELQNLSNYIRLSLL